MRWRRSLSVLYKQDTGAGELGIKALWINRSKKMVQEGVVVIENLMEIFDKVTFIEDKSVQKKY